MTLGTCVSIVLAVAACDCGSSPRSTFYALSPQPGLSEPAGLRTVKIRRPGLAGYLDRPEIVRGIVDHRIAIADTDRWGEPLDAMVARVLAQDLEQRLPGVTVFTEDGPITTD
ncbi:MAG: PqiC family protein, partial [Polyangiaceae bacterium]